MPGEPCVTSGPHGEYSIASLPGGSYLVYFFVPEESSLNLLSQYYGGFEYEEAQSVLVAEGATTKGIDVQLQLGGRVTGHVSDKVTAKGLEGVEVCAIGPRGRCVESGAGGGYMLTGLAAGKYAIEFSTSAEGPLSYLTQFYGGAPNEEDAQALEVVAGKTVAGIDAALDPAAEIEGKVTAKDTGDPLGSIQVCAREVEGNSYLHCVRTHTDGSYRIGSLASGFYDVYFQGSGNYVSARYAEGTPVEVSATNALGGIDGVLSPGGKLEGAVTSASGHEALEAIEVCALPVSYQYDQVCTTTRHDGTYVIEGLAASEYVVEFRPSFVSSWNYIPQYFESTDVFQQAQPLSVKAESPTQHVDAELQTGARMTGAVTESITGQPLQHVSVCASPLAGGFVSCASTASDGSYTVQRLATGTYTVNFNPVDGQHVATSTAGVAVTAGGTTQGVDAALVLGGVIEGTVTSKTSGAPLAAVNVCAVNITSFPGLCAQTNAAGHYAIRPLPSGEYRVQFSPNVGSYLAQYYRGAATATEAETMTVGAPATTSGIDAALKTGGQINGTVTDATSGASVQSVQVQAQLSNGGFYSTYTNSSGHYALSGLPTGEYRVSFFPQDNVHLKQFYEGRRRLAEADLVAVPDEGAVSEVNAPLQRGSTISGTARDAITAAPIVGVDVCADSAEAETHACGHTDSEGHYHVGGLEAGAYMVNFSDYGGGYLSRYYHDADNFAESQPVSVAVGATTSGIDEDLVLGGAVTGTVKNASTSSGLGSIEACALPVAEGIERCGFSAADGSYAIKGLPAGEYKLSFQPQYNTGNYIRQYFEGAATLAAAKPVTVALGSAASGIDAAMQPGGAISGHVTSHAGGTPLSNVLACAHAMAEVERQLCAYSDSHGAYTIVGLGSGQYKVSFSLYSYTEAFYNGEHNLEDADSVSVTAGESTSAIDAVVRQRGEVTGRVTDAGGSTPLAGIEVCAMREGFIYAGCVRSAADGTYTLAGLVTGKYAVEFRSPFENALNYLLQWYPGKTRSSEAQQLEVNEGETVAGINAPMQLGGEVSGTVTAQAGGGPIEKIRACATRIGEFESYCGRTDAKGRYTIAALLAGEYTVYFENAGFNYAGQYYSGKRNAAEGQHVAVVLGATTGGIDASLATGAIVTGIVRSANSKAALSGINVYVLNAETGSYATSTATGANGTYKAQGLPTGSYRIEFSPFSSEYNVQWYDHRLNQLEADPVSATQGSTTSEINADLISPPPVATASPSVTGSAQEGHKLAEVHGTWTHEPTGYTYRWIRCSSEGLGCQTIGGASAQAYEPVEADVGSRLEVEESATNAAGAGKGVTSGPTAIVLPLPPTSIHVPTIIGFAQQGQALTAENGSWTRHPTTRKLQWLRCDSAGASCTAIDKANEDAYTPIAADVGHRLEFEERAENAGGLSEPADSKPTAVVVPPVPATIAPPTVTGVAKQGGTLEEHHGEWTYEPDSFTYQWERCDATGKECSVLSGQNASTYKLTGQDVGHTTVVAERAHNAGGYSQLVPSPPTPQVVASSPVVVKAPQISGVAQEAHELSSSTGSWTNEPDKYEYLWLRCDAQGDACSPIAGATSASYEPVHEDVDHELAVEVTVRNAGGTGASTSEPSAQVLPLPPHALAAPAVEGSAAQGQMLSEKHGGWTGEPSEYAYRWQRCDALGTSCLPIPGAEAPGYRLTAADVGYAITVQEIASNAGGESEPAASSPTDVIVAARPELESAPFVTGTPQEGHLLSSSQGAWTNEPKEYAYRWLRCDSRGEGCAAIDGAEAETYEAGHADVGHELRVEVLSRNAGGTSDPAISEATAVVITLPPRNLHVPEIEGGAVEGATLSEVRDEWTNVPESFAYRWERCDANGENCTLIGGAEAQSYTLGEADVGHRIVVTERAVNAGGASEPAVSAPTELVSVAVPVNISPPQVEGSPHEGGQLHAGPGSWSNEPMGRAYRWLRCDSHGEACEAIEGATSSGYEVAHADVGLELRVRETASNAAGTGEAATSDPTAPISAKARIEASIIEAPGPRTRAAGPFVFSATEEGSLECSVDSEGDFAPCMSPLTLEGLPDGEHTLFVRAVNGFGQAEAPAVSRKFDLDTTPPIATLTKAPSEPLHSGNLGFGYESSEAGEMQCAVDEGEWHDCGGENFFAEEFANGEHRFKVRAIDPAGNVSPVVEAAFTIVNRPPTASLQVAGDSGPAPLTTTATIEAADPDEDGLGYQLQFGDGSSASGVLPAKSFQHTYDEPGVYEMRLDVTDGHEHVVITRTITVTLPEPLKAKAGEDQTVISGEKITLDGEDSRPLRGIAGYRWNFGDGEEADGGTVEHAYAAPGDYKAILTVSAPGRHDSTSVTIHVLPKPGGEGYVEDVESGGSPLEGAEVLVILGDGTRVRGISGADGKAHLYGLGDGEYEAYVYKPSYIPTATHALVQGHEGAGTVELKPGNTATAHVTSHLMNLKEIEDAGIDPNDPANRHVYEFDVHINVVPFAPAGGGGGGVGGGAGAFGGYIGGGGFVGGSCDGKTTCVWHAGGATIFTTVTFVPGAEAPILSSLVIPFRASWLKEFFSVSMIVDNLAPAPFTLSGGHATISVPGGMSLAPTAVKQAYTQSLPDIPGEGSATAQWVLRGDTEGEYNVAATYAASLEPFGRILNLSAATTTPIHVWGASAIQLTVDVDKQLKDSYPFHVKVGMKDVADVPVYDPQIELLKRGRHGYIEQPAQQNAYATREIGPGETFWSGEFILVPEATGEVDLKRSFIQKVGGDVELHPSLVTHDRVLSLGETPTIKGHRRNASAIALEWDPVPGATAYKVFKTPDRETDFPNTPDATAQQLGSTKAVVRDAPSDPQSYFAVSSLVNGRWTMVHPMIGSDQVTPGEYPHIQVADESECGSSAVAGTATFTDPDFPLKKWAGVINGTTLSGGSLTGNLATASFAGTSTQGEVAPYTLTVESEEGAVTASPTTAVDSLGGCRATGLGDSFSSGEGNPPFEPETRGENPGENSCHRSEESAYLKIAAKRTHNLEVLNFKACSGAKTGAFWSPQESNTKAQSEEIAPGSNLVTLSMGGNDVYFADFLIGCIVDRVVNIPEVDLLPPCKAAAAPVVAALMPGLRSRLKGIYEAIAKTSGHPRVIVMGYPEIFPERAPGLSTKLTCDLISGTDIEYWHETVEDVNAEIEAAAHAAGAEFVNPNDYNGRRRFNGHDVCQGAPDSFFNPIISPIGPRGLVESFHPNKGGQEAMAEALEEEIANPQGTSQNLHTGENLTEKAVVTDLDAALNGVVRWPGSDVELRFKAPNGTTIDRGNIPAGVEHSLTGTSETYTIPDPEPGEWEVEAVGKQLAPSGEQVSLDTTVTPHHDKNPQAVFSNPSQRSGAPYLVEFNGGESVDPEGRALTYEWQFGDGTTASGSSTPHVYKHGGEYRPTLIVKTGDGRTNTTVGAPVFVTEAPNATSAPAIQGQAEVGAHLTCDKGRWAGYPSPTYAVIWDRDGTPTGTTGEDYLVSSADASHKIWCEVTASNEVGHSTERSEGIEIGKALAAPNIKLQPKDVTVPDGVQAVFTAGAEGNPVPVVRWQRSHAGGAYADIIGATSYSLVLGHVAVAESGDRFHAVFSNSQGEAVTEPAILAVRQQSRAPRWTGYCKKSKGKQECGLFPIGFTGSGGPVVMRVRNHKLSCKKLTSSGEVLETSVQANVVLMGCRVRPSNARCQSGIIPGEVRFMPSEDRLGYVERKRHFGYELGPAPNSPSGHGLAGLIATIHCGTQPAIRLEGGAIGTIRPANRLARSYLINFDAGVIVVAGQGARKREKLREYAQVPDAFVGEEPVKLIAWVGEEPLGAALDFSERLILAHRSMLEG